ncbi:MAG: DUF4838 domain-containing protein [Lentisphaeria bacterium]|nr:DUF4838 domain-containing protein [Lentisphaeria bacterium]
MKKTVITLLAGLAAVMSAGEITLAENGQAKAGIVIPEKAKPIVRLAAKELADHLKKMTGAEFEIGSRPNAEVNFYLGFGKADQFVQSEHVIAAQGNRIDIYGKDTASKVKLFNYFFDEPDKGTLSGVYHFLDTLGVRWLAPGKDGVHVPVRKTVRIPERQLHFRPYFQDRQITDSWNFMRHPDAKEYVKNPDGIYLWGIRNQVSTRSMVPGCHSERSLGLFKNPEWLKHTSAHQLMKNGRRNPNYSCWTDPFTKEIWMRAVDGYFSGKAPKECGFNIKSYLHSKWPYPFLSPNEFMIDPMDHDQNNDGRCYCERCQEFRKKHPCRDDSEIIWKVISEIAQEVEKKYPGRYISTLVYPPKKQLPKLSVKPRNIRVRICLTGARAMIFPDQLKYDMKLLTDWGALLGPKNIPLWIYQCTADFGRFLPGVPDVYPHLTAKYIRTVKPHCAGMYCENHQQTHTYRNMDVYIYMRLLWNPDLDIEQELADYFRLYYGPAAKPAQELFRIFEENWIRIDRMICTDPTGQTTRIGVVKANKEKYQKQIWSQVYNLDEMKKLDGLMRQMKELAPAGSVYANRVRLLQKYMIDVIKAERSEVMDKEEKRLKLKLPVPAAAGDAFPSDEEWNKAPEYKLIPAVRLVSRLEAPGSFRLLASKDCLFVRADLKDAGIARSQTDPKHQTGNQDVWKDNCFELFFYAEKSRKLWQVIVNDRNAWSSLTWEKKLPRWEQLKGLKTAVRRTADGWTADITIPFSELQTDRSDLRFNCTRERNLKGKKTEFSTWSPLAMLGNWQGVDNYGTLVFLPEKK